MFEVVCISKGSKLYLSGGMTYRVHAVNKVDSQFTQFLLFIDGKWEWHDATEFIPKTVEKGEI